MMVSPAASSGVSAATVLSVTSPAGTISQKVRGAFNLATSASSEAADSRALPLDRAARRLGGIESHHPVTAAQQSLRHVGTHPARDQSSQFP